MNKILFKIICEFSKIVKYILMLFSILLLLGTIICLFLKDRILESIANNYDLSHIEGLGFFFIIGHLIKTLLAFLDACRVTLRKW